MKIYLSPSDQHANTTASGHSESYHCLKIAEECKKVLEKNGYSVRIGDCSKENLYDERVLDSNKWGADLHVCIHTNAGGGVGTLMLAHPSSVNNLYVKNIYNSVANLTPTKDRGIQARNDLYEINATNCVCAYLECEFHDNLNTEKWIDENISKIGKAIALGIIGNSSNISKPTGKSNEEIAREVIRGDWGNGNDRKNRLESAGYNYNTIQNLVNSMLNGSASKPIKAMKKLRVKLFAVIGKRK